ncbi:MAG: SUMF1/EgtB/PvdO family nonheme iron enzyme, partial [Planctomycetaceae bacterium]|nr:SUMF1/EgtB/PvdO family nonheme iron enzyme [Planctomycetaceae bacterium]
GDSEETLENLANLADASLREKLGTEWGVPWDDGFAFTSPVGQQRANAFGLHDVHGGVWEWCRDIYSATYYASSPATDPTGPQTGTLRVVRGGSWATAAKFARSADRSSFQPTERNLMVGFRIVREVAP